MKKIKERLDIIFQEVFNLPDFIPSLEMSAGDVEEWDSLSHAILIVSVEEEFSIHFDTLEISNLQSVGDLVSLIERKLKE